VPSPRTATVADAVARRVTVASPTAGSPSGPVARAVSLTVTSTGTSAVARPTAETGRTAVARTSGLAHARTREGVCSAPPPPASGARAAIAAVTAGAQDGEHDKEGDAHADQDDRRRGGAARRPG
jgi:hypothetical protein